MLSKEFRQRGDQCEKMARESPDVLVQDLLNELASEFRSKRPRSNETKRVNSNSRNLNPKNEDNKE
jgi:hypothetical protein